MPTLTPEEFEMLTASILTDETPVQVITNVRELWLTCCSLQGITRHPGIHAPLIDLITRIANEMYSAIEAVHPNSRPLWDAGWDPDNDEVYDEYDDDDDDFEDNFFDRIFGKPDDEDDGVYSDDEPGYFSDPS